MRGRRAEAHGRHRPGHDVRHPRREGPSLQAQRPVRRQVPPAAPAAAEAPPLHLHPAQPGGERPGLPFPAPDHRPAALPAFRPRQRPVQPPRKKLRRRRAARRKVRRQLRKPGAQFRRDGGGHLSGRPLPGDIQAPHPATLQPVPGEPAVTFADHRRMDGRPAFRQTPGYATASGCRCTVFPSFRVMIRTPALCLRQRTAGRSIRSLSGAPSPESDGKNDGVNKLGYTLRTLRAIAIEISTFHPDLRPANFPVLGRRR